MLVALQVVTLTLVGIAVGLVMAHSLEWPGKLRLTREQYLATQQIYYPGFTWAGVAEPLGLLLTLILVVQTPLATPRFWLGTTALILLFVMHGAYWLLTHPINRVWLAGARLSHAGAEFFGADRSPRDGLPAESDWRRLRYRWELSHAIRAGFGLGAFVLLLTATAL
jgi:polyferredoxin